MYFEWKKRVLVDLYLKGKKKNEKSNFLLEAMRTLPLSRLLGTLACEREEI